MLHASPTALTPSFFFLPADRLFLWRHSLAAVTVWILPQTRTVNRSRNYGILVGFNQIITFIKGNLFGLRRTHEAFVF